MPDHDPVLDELQKKIDSAAGSTSTTSKQGNNGNLSLVARFSVELLAGVFVGCALGYGLDQLFGTMPLFFIICMLLGSAGGMMNIVRTSKQMDQQNSNPSESSKQS